MYCEHCGKHNLKNQKTCINCGLILHEFDEQRKFSFRINSVNGEKQRQKAISILLALAPRMSKDKINKYLDNVPVTLSYNLSHKLANKCQFYFEQAGISTDIFITELKKCPNCRQENYIKSKYCIKCGTQFPLEKNYLVILKQTEDEKIKAKVIRYIRSKSPKINHLMAKKLVETAPRKLYQNLTKEEATNIKIDMDNMGAPCIIRTPEKVEVCHFHNNELANGRCSNPDCNKPICVECTRKFMDKDLCPICYSEKAGEYEEVEEYKRFDEEEIPERVTSTGSMVPILLLLFFVLGFATFYVVNLFIGSGTFMDKVFSGEQAMASGKIANTELVERNAMLIRQRKELMDKLFIIDKELLENYRSYEYEKNE